jgi:UDP-N-acetylmuramoylalanine--D-glutamate ligase
LQARTIGITGTKGKSTTAALTTAMLKSGGLDARLAGNIGNSVFNEIETATSETVFTLELSSYQLSDIEYSPDIAVCTNLYNDHSNWHGSRELYQEAKHRMIAKSEENDLFIYNPAFSLLVSWAQSANCRVMAIDEDENIDLSNSKLFGEHNRLNALTARLVARELGVTDEACQNAVDNFEPLPHRMQFVAKREGRVFIDDAIGMTPESTIASIKAVSEKYGRIGCLLLGGQDRDYSFSELFELLSQQQIPNLVLFPDTIEKMRSVIPIGYKPTLYEANNMKDAVSWAKQHAPENSVVLLSTAAPSYSLWKSGFEEKGRLFQENVLNM